MALTGAGFSPLFGRFTINMLRSAHLCFKARTTFTTFVPIIKTPWYMISVINNLRNLIWTTCLFLVACNGVVGIKKDLTNGITTTYNGLEPAQIFKVMNGEVVNHNFVVLGESFAIINEGVKGLKAKDGKVSVGCALLITDEAGNKLLDELDLFAGHDVLGSDTTRQLKCTINTGKPMEYEKKYLVKTTFWDKYGKGKIENSFSIDIEDIP